MTEVASAVHMDSELSRRDLVRAGAALGVVGLAGCVGKLPQDAQCMLNRPSYTFTPETPLENEQEVNQFSRSLKGRVTVAHKKHGYLPDHTVTDYDEETGATTMRFAGAVDKATVEDVVATPGTVTVTLTGNGTSTVIFESKDYRRQTRLKQRDSGWSANIPLSVKEKDSFQQTLKDAGVTENPSAYTLTVSYNDTSLREVTLSQKQADQLVSEEWDGSLIVTQLSKHEAVVLSARFNGGSLPVAATVESLC